MGQRRTSNFHENTAFVTQSLNEKLTSLFHSKWNSTPILNPYSKQKKNEGSHFKRNRSFTSERRVKEKQKRDRLTRHTDIIFFFTLFVLCLFVCSFSLIIITLLFSKTNSFRFGLKRLSSRRALLNNSVYVVIIVTKITSWGTCVISSCPYLFTESLAFRSLSKALE